CHLAPDRVRARRPGWRCRPCRRGGRAAGGARGVGAPSAARVPRSGGGGGAAGLLLAVRPGGRGARHRARQVGRVRSAAPAAAAPADPRWLDGRTAAPRIVRAGHHLARPKRYLRYYARELDDVTGLPAAMAEEAGRGDGWVKIVGDWIDRARGADSVLEPLWPL